MEEAMSLITLSTEADPGLIQKFLDEGTDLNERDKRGRTGKSLDFDFRNLINQIELDSKVQSTASYRTW